jgi:hypothetical protein
LRQFSKVKIIAKKYHKYYVLSKDTTEEKQQPVVSNDLSKEVAAIKAQLLVLVSRLDHIEQQEMIEH